MMPSIILFAILYFIPLSRGDNSTICDKDNEFSCRNGECIDIAYECDMESDCSDGSDEAHCFYCKKYSPEIDI